MGAKRLTGRRNVLNWDKSSRRRGRNVLKMGAKRLGGQNVYGAKCPGAFLTAIIETNWYGSEALITLVMAKINIISK